MVKKRTILICLVTIACLCFSYTLNVIADDHVHSWSRWITEEKPTISEKGSAYRYCYDCDKTQEKTLPKKKLTSKQKQVATAAKKYLNAVKTYNVKTLRSSFAAPVKNGIFYSMKDHAAYCRKYNKKYFDYEIKSISVSGKSATVKIDAEYPDCYLSCYNGMEDTITWMIYRPGASTASVQKYCINQIKKETKANGVDYIEKTITIKYQKTSKGWKIKTLTKALNNMMNCEYQRAYDDVFAGY